jgi:polyribonucleotide nucleotidyltransferase
MATVCGGCLALLAGGQKMSEMIAGVAMGLISDEVNYAVLSDISGLEDHDGDMDFKVAGSREAITALQMDIKLGGISLELLSKALNQAKQARSHILNIMEEAAEKIVVNSSILPKVENLKVNPTKIVDLLGQGGKVIKSIIEKYEVKIDINRESGSIQVIGRTIDNVDKACEEIKKITDDRELYEIYKKNSILPGIVKQITNFGAFVELPAGHEGMIHISKIADHRIDKIEDFIKITDKIKVKVLGIKGKKIELQLYTDD